MSKAETNVLILLLPQLPCILMLSALMRPSWSYLILLHNILCQGFASNTPLPVRLVKSQREHILSIQRAFFWKENHYF